MLHFSILPLSLLTVLIVALLKEASNQVKVNFSIPYDILFDPSRPLMKAKSLRLNMVFDFLRKRAEEGISQVQNIATKSIEGKLGEALKESADYIQQRQKIDSMNFKRLTAGNIELRSSF